MALTGQPEEKFLESIVEVTEGDVVPLVCGVISLNKYEVDEELEIVIPLSLSAPKKEFDAGIHIRQLYKISY